MKKYTWIRVHKEAKEELDKRLKYINQVDLKKIGVKNKQIPQIEFTSFLFKNKIFMSDSELKSMACKKFKGKIC